jgi:glycyl-tRNA synthetase beta chain
MPTLLFEIGCEELPASACRAAEEQLPQLCARHLGAPPTEVLVGPRRIAFLLEGLPERTEDTWAQGPPVDLRDRAGEGFARRHGRSAAELEERDGFLGVMVPGRPIADVLPELLRAVVRGLTFAKSMTWGPPIRFVRPIRWLCAKLDSEMIDVGLEGVPSVAHTYGHRFSSSEVEFHDAGAYAGYLRNAGVEPDACERRRRILEGLKEAGDWDDPGGILGETVYIAESPTVIVGSFDERFLELPARVTVTAMQHHQLHFPLGGNRFALVANGGDADVVRAGNERVLEGRLDDATFTFERDLAVGIEGLAARLRSITFVAGAGTFADKADRLVPLVEALGGGEASCEAARLAKADQSSELVREFAELEGAIGAEYARIAGFPEAVSAAIEEQYLPDAAGGPLPGTEPGRVLATADKVDNLAVAFALGQLPSGSRDPYGLRRAAIGLCRLALEGGVEIDLPRLVATDRMLLVEQGVEVDDGSLAELPGFVYERLEGILDVPVEFVRAARNASAQLTLGTIARLAQALAALEDGRLGRVHTAYARADRLAGRAAEEAADTLQPEFLAEPAETELVRALARVEPAIGEALDAGDLEAAIGAAEELGPLVDHFFDQVLVMADDRTVRANRLRLLLDVRDAVGRLGDFSEIPR